MKQAVRKEIIARRNAITTTEQQTWSREIVEHLLASNVFDQVNLVMAYMAIGKEVDLSPLYPGLWQRGIRVAVPVCLPDRPGIMQAAELKPEMLEEMATGMMHIPEPPTKAFLAPQEIDLVLAPGVAFDRKGGRIGYGAGYYDRFIPQLRQGVPLWGICYQLQVVADAFSAAHDMPMAALVTEAGISFCS